LKDGLIFRVIIYYYITKFWFCQIIT